MESVECENCKISNNSHLSWTGQNCDTSFEGGACRVCGFSLLLEIIKGFIVRDYSLTF